MNKEEPLALGCLSTIAIVTLSLFCTWIRAHTVLLVWNSTLVGFLSLPQMAFGIALGITLMVTALSFYKKPGEYEGNWQAMQEMLAITLYYGVVFLLTKLAIFLFL